MSTEIPFSDLESLEALVCTGLHAYVNEGFKALVGSFRLVFLTNMDSAGVDTAHQFAYALNPQQSRFSRITVHLPCYNTIHQYCVAQVVSPASAHESCPKT